ncbi:MAG: Flp/Fap pilin component [Firmicutes bacterium ADurb.Bin248]|nr:MAG: Flp/Fap pilin component [Firmicutes bacterium ADurb.Bin248]HOF99743.1 Flp family type IVb pilin [Clostridia bacterium]
MLNILRDENGQGMVEYGLLLGLIALVVVGALVLLGPSISKMFNDAKAKLDDPSK